MAMEQLLRSGEARPGDTALLLGFGAGLAYAGRWSSSPRFRRQDRQETSPSLLGSDGLVGVGAERSTQ